ncbi:transposase [Nostoc sp. NIES-3756]|nr:transposase [Nostoc sp. NIES-3756]BAY38336.1 transposase [Nostoc sp. NIES-2111]
MRTLLLDTKPISVVGYKPDKSQSDFTGSADYGLCASRNMNYFGHKLAIFIKILCILIELVKSLNFIQLY